MREMRQPTVLQESRGNRLASWLFVLAVHAAMLVIMMLGLTGKVVVREGPAMAVLFSAKLISDLPAPSFLPITIAKPVAEVPEVKVEEEEPAAPAPVPEEVTPSPIEAPPSDSDSTILASQVLGGDGSGIGDDGAQRSAGGASGGGGELNLNEYLRRVSDYIQRYVPRGMPRGSATAGLARVYLRWTRDGTVTAVKLVGSSGDDWIDNAAILAVKRAKQLPPIPPEFRLTAMEGNLPVYYKR